jgi:hypothetical protein
MINWEGLGRKRTWPNRGTILSFPWRDGGKPQITLVTKAEIKVKVNFSLEQAMKAQREKRGIAVLFI